MDTFQKKINIYNLLIFDRKKELEKDNEAEQTGDIDKLISTIYMSFRAVLETSFTEMLSVKNADFKGFFALIEMSNAKLNAIMEESENLLEKLNSYEAQIMGKLIEILLDDINMRIKVLSPFIL